MPHFNDEPCPCGRGQAMAELAAELVKLKQDHEETETIALLTHEICLVLLKRSGLGYADLMREISVVRKQSGGGIREILDEPKTQAEGG